MNQILNLYLHYKEWISLLKDGVFLYGGIKLVRYLSYKKYEATLHKIEENLRFRQKIETELRDYIIEKASNGRRDIAIRFIFWKNYPWNLDDDAYKFSLHVDYFNDKPSGGWIDNTGIKFEHSIWWYGQSLYADSAGIYFIDKASKLHKGFTEFPNTYSVLHLPFKNIVNFDFRERIEYEPIFYTRCRYNNWKRLYDDKFRLKNKDGRPYLNFELSQRLQLRRYTFGRYKAKQVRVLIGQIMKLARIALRGAVPGQKNSEVWLGVISSLRNFLKN